MSARAIAVTERPARRVGLIAPPEERIALPHREQLEERFGRPLDSIAVYAGRHVAKQLARVEAHAATQGGRIFLTSSAAPLPVVAHEVAHALQARSGAPPVRSDSVAPAGSAAEREAAQVAAEASRPHLPGSRVTVSQGISHDTVALLRVAPRTGGAPTIEITRPAQARSKPVAQRSAEPNPSPGPAPANAAP
ncbi:MAG: DUF4157 domain-containing protein, partial [Candidatus Nanopelagicales bacterium]